MLKLFKRTEEQERVRRGVERLTTEELLSQITKLEDRIKNSQNETVRSILSYMQNKEEVIQNSTFQDFINSLLNKNQPTTLAGLRNMIKNNKNFGNGDKKRLSQIMNDCIRELVAGKYGATPKRVEKAYQMLAAGKVLEGSDSADKAIRQLTTRVTKDKPNEPRKVDARKLSKLVRKATENYELIRRIVDKSGNPNETGQEFLHGSPLDKIKYPIAILLNTKPIAQAVKEQPFANHRSLLNMVKNSQNIAAVGSAGYGIFAGFAHFAKGFWKKFISPELKKQASPT